MNVAAVETLLRGIMGLDAATLGSAAVTRAVQSRMEAHSISDSAVYERLLQKSDAERQELIESLIVPETWFFRDREAFATLGRLALEAWARVAPGGVVRLLSLPCSTGEEPYSMAMCLFEAGLSAPSFRIDAVDISRPSLARARLGNYGRNSFRGGRSDFRDRYFAGRADRWQINDEIRHQVNFIHGNLVDPGLLAGAAPYDIVFCRNVLIYFDEAAQKQVVATLKRLLAPEGALFMGPSESGLLPAAKFGSARLSHSFVFRHARIAARATEKTRPRREPPRADPPAAVKTKPRPLPTPASAPVPISPPVSAQPSGPSFEDIMHLADQGRLDNAAAQAEEHLRLNGPSVRIYSLLGLIHDAAQRPPEAIAHYRKALYLDPRDEEVLAHLGALLKGQGENVEAQRLLNRTKRAAQRQGA